MIELTLIKLGGSVITDKQVPQTLRGPILSRLATEIATAGTERPIVLGHGSGSFGHPAAAATGIAAGLAHDDQRRGISVTQIAARHLHQHVLEALEQAGLLPVSLPPASWSIAEDGILRKQFLDPLVTALQQGLLPVVMGDVVLDRRRGAVVISTETILQRLATDLPSKGVTVTRALWVGDTLLRGLQGEPLAVFPAGANDLKSWIGGSAGIDVTGGMLHRARTALELARDGIESWILDGTVPGCLQRALEGDRSVTGTFFPGREK